MKQKWRQNVKDREIREGIETRVNERDTYSILELERERKKKQQKTGNIDMDISEVVHNNKLKKEGGDAEKFLLFNI